MHYSQCTINKLFRVLQPRIHNYVGTFVRSNSMTHAQLIYIYQLHLLLLLLQRERWYVAIINGDKKRHRVCCRCMSTHHFNLQRCECGCLTKYNMAGWRAFCLCISSEKIWDLWINSPRTRAFGSVLVQVRIKIVCGGCGTFYYEKWTNITVWFDREMHLIEPNNWKFTDWMNDYCDMWQIVSEYNWMLDP